MSPIGSIGGRTGVGSAVHPLPALTLPGGAPTAGPAGVWETLDAPPSVGVEKGGLYALDSAFFFDGASYMIYDPAIPGWVGAASCSESGDCGLIENGGLIFTSIANGPSPPTIPTAQAFMFAYDPVMDTWDESSYTAMTTPRRFPVWGECAGLLYAAGGRTAGAGTEVTTVERYDPTSDTWTARASLDVALQEGQGAEASGKLYCWGYDAGTVRGRVYNPGGNSWASISAPPLNLSPMLVAALPSDLLLVGGGGNGGDNDRFWIYDPSDDSYTEVPVAPYDRLAIAAANGSTVYCITADGTPRLATFTAF